MKKLFVLALILISNITYSQDCYKNTIQSPTPFLGNHGEIVKLADGSVWEIQYQYEYMYEYYPAVIACPSKGTLMVRNKKLSARVIKSTSSSNSTSVIESYIESNFNGLNMGNIYKLSNGQIWEQTEAWAWAWSWSRPSVMIYRDGGIIKMKVENIDHAVAVEQIK